MSSDSFTKENLDTYLKALAKEFKKLNGKYIPAEIVLVGGAAILTNYGFRDMTTDIDAVIHATSAIKDAINLVGDKYNLPNGWLNSDFMHTSSYSPKLNEFSLYYKTFYGVLSVRTISAEYLIAMKLRSGRKYKNDLSDIIGILAEHEKKGAPITYDKIETAIVNLYGGWNDFPEDSKPFIEDALKNGNFENIYTSVKQEEIESKDILIGFEKDYPKVAKESNINDILKTLKEKRNNQ
jgi:predicted nucleotidyltransferase